MNPIIPILLLACFCNAQNYEFTDDFIFGVATASYQVEGAWNMSGKGENIWDHITHTNPSFVANNDNGDVACDAYHKTEEDVQLLVAQGVTSYRISLSWSRILPHGHSYYVNPDGIRYYNELFDKLLKYNITPMVTLFHYDLPQPLQDIGGWPNSALADIYVDYARVVFENFGDRVKNWITFNEPSIFCVYGYSYGTAAPGLAQDGIGGYMCSYTILMAHANTYHLYNDQYRDTQNGRVGITLQSYWYSPESDSDEDAEAAERAVQMSLGLFAHPIYSETGDYPPSIRERIDALSAAQGFTRSRLPILTSEEIETIRGTFDFLGLNHYTTSLCSAEPSAVGEDIVSHDSDLGILCYQSDEWESSGSPWLKVVPWGLRELLRWIKNEYNNPEVIITENGVSDNTGTLNDCRRIYYYNAYMSAVLQAINEDGCNVTGYYAWSFMDNFEWSAGYAERFGLHFVDFEDPSRPRTRKMSSYVYSNIIENKKIDWSYTPEGFDQCEW